MTAGFNLWMRWTPLDYALTLGGLTAILLAALLRDAPAWARETLLLAGVAAGIASAWRGERRRNERP